MKSIGLSYMSWWGDQYEDIVAGDAFFLTDFIIKLTGKEYTVYALQDDRDNGEPMFEGFMDLDRLVAYDNQHFTKDFPELDILWVQWRWKMPGRNYGIGASMNDWYRQEELLKHYHDNTDTKIFIFDADGKLTKADELAWPKAHILTVASNPKLLSQKRIQTFWPFDFTRLAEQEWRVHAPWNPTKENTYCTDPNLVLAYIGNDYERKESFDKWIGEPARDWAASKAFHVYGNWLKYPEKAIKNEEDYPDIVFHPKVTKPQMLQIYSRALFVPLLAKEEYNQLGHMTYRLPEVMYSGGIPVGFSEFTGIEKYVIPELVVEDQEQYKKLITKLMCQSHKERIDLWKKQINHFTYGPDEYIDILEKS